MLIRIARRADIARWAEFRAALWPEGTVENHRHEAAAWLDEPEELAVAFVALGDDGELAGFAEASLRRDYVNGCTTSPVAFVEGIYVGPARRGTGTGRALIAAVEAWGRERGCSELASDALLDNRGSHAFHQAVGFEETERVVYFRKTL
jgi:aminoglycoside 6'-N-acetyltransferase I